MKLLFDQNISFRITKKLEGHFSGCVHVSDCNLNNRNDMDIWAFAKQNDYSIVTFDSDFYDLSMINGHPPKIIWIRTCNLTTDEIAHLMFKNLVTIKSFLKNTDLENAACLELG